MVCGTWRFFALGPTALAVNGRLFAPVPIYCSVDSDDWSLDEKDAGKTNESAEMGLKEMLKEGSVGDGDGQNRSGTRFMLVVVESEKQKGWW